MPVSGVTLPTFMTGSGPGPGFASTGPGPGYTPLNTFWQLKSNEALITIITLPPQAAYFSQQSYMVERNALYYTATAPGPVPCTPGTSFPTGTFPNIVHHIETPDCNFNVFGFFNNAINNALIQQQAGYSFSNYGTCAGSNCAIAIITTPNQQIMTDATTGFGSVLHYNTAELFEESMATGSGTPSPLLYVAPPTGSMLPLPPHGPDTMATILRYTLPNDSGVSGSPSYAWQQAIGTNVLTFRVTMPTGGTITPIATPAVPITAQSCNTDESGYAPPTGPALCPNGALVQTHLATLRTLLLNWMQSHVSTSYTFGTSTSNPPSVGFNCLTTGISCAGGIPDNNAYRSFSPGALLNGLPILAIGVLHSASVSDTTTAIPASNAVYTGMSISDDSLNAGMTGENMGVADQTQSNLLATGFSKGNLAGSAAQILSDLGITSSDTDFMADLPNLYVVVFNQSGGPCVFPGSGGSGCSKSYVVNINATMLPTTDPTKTTERGYLDPPATASSPASTAMRIAADPDYMTSPFVLYVPPSP